ncbi:hypothetical protein DFP72DRAFT_1067865 [Ephemerocybe angulata]|uniref:Uncharacterized protein n=1 Tax=Ephemerocybe angulata TaxID=980116 RepID=A0A8H6M7P2_9AGAR|nr:hypothetical protein DFP72DRAFT_1067865 [Tulosesus angulatus]
MDHEECQAHAFTDAFNKTKSESEHAKRAFLERRLRITEIPPCWSEECIHIILKAFQQVMSKPNPTHPRSTPPSQPPTLSKQTTISLNFSKIAGRSFNLARNSGLKIARPVLSNPGTKADSVDEDGQRA